VEARAKIARVAGANWFVARYAREGNSPPPQFLLPCQLLEQVESFADANPSPRLKVSGEVTRYRGRDFLLLSEVIVEESPRPADSARDGRADANSAAALAIAETRPVLLTELAASAPASDANGAASRPASAPASDPAGASPFEIISRMARERPGKTIVSTAPLSPTQPAARSVAPRATQPAIASAKGSMIVDRVVRIQPESKDGWWDVLFQGDNTLREPPIRLLPSALLEEAEKEVSAAPGGRIKFRVSGELAEYKGRRYLLLRKLLVEKDLGQL
jgi:hypothetical protein